jgi:GNAT superfamily N-acetyltransferase
MKENGRVGMLHPGDVAHHIYNGLRRDDPTELVHLWEDGSGEIRAWTLLDPSKAGHDPQIDMSMRKLDPVFETEVNTWSEEALLALMHQQGSEATFIETDADEADVERISILESLGWEAQDIETLMLTSRSLTDLKPVEMPDGFTVRTVRGVEEAGAVSELHAAGFGSSWTPELYARVMTSPGYSPDREFVVEAPNGDLAAFCVTWPDVINRIGLFEPVAVHPDYRRLGLGRAVMRAGMVAMRQWGMQHAEVMYETSNPGSGPLYRDEGFVPIKKVVLYRKPLPRETQV